MPAHTEKRVIPYTPEQLFELVAGVEHYPEFLPWCSRAVIRSRTDTEIVADLTVGFGPFRETYTSRVTLERTERILVRSERGPFKHLNNQWTFEPDERGCLVGFQLTFEFRSMLLRNAIGMVFGEAVKRMVNAFIARARAVYGPSPFTHK